MPLLSVDIPPAKRAELLATLKSQYAELVARESLTIHNNIAVMACKMVESTPSFYFCNNLFPATQAFASTRVIVKQQGVVVKSSVHVKRNVGGDLMDAIVIKGPSYKLQLPSQHSDALVLHASTGLFNVYSCVMHALRQSPAPVLASLPPIPPEVAQVKFDHDAAVAATLPLFQAISAAPTPAATPVATPPPVATPTPVAQTPSHVEEVAGPAEASPSPDRDRAPKRQRTGAATSTCYICFKTKTCDILFPCRVASHACCRKCIKLLYEMWSNDEYEGKATIKCPQCGYNKGLIERADGKQIWLGSRYLLRKKRRPSYAPVELSL